MVNMDYRWWTWIYGSVHHVPLRELPEEEEIKMKWFGWIGVWIFVWVLLSIFAWITLLISTENMDDKETVIIAGMAVLLTSATALIYYSVRP